jgi:hypothetical protein
MLRPQRLIALSVLIALSGALTGCSSSVSNWDPTDLLDFLDTKKKLPGERKPVFPEGVPGLEQGVPKSLYKDNVDRSALQQQQNAAVIPAPPVEDPKAKRSAKSTAKGKPAVTATAPAQDAEPAPDADAATEEGSTAAAPPAPKPAKKLVRKRTTSLPPDQSSQPAQATGQAQPQSAASPFPAPMPSGGFSR